jgi:hypothetical protein
VAVVLLTALGVVVALRVQPATPEVAPPIAAAAVPEPEPKVAPKIAPKPEPVAAPVVAPVVEPEPAPAPGPRSISVHNVYNGRGETVNGAVVQIGYVDKSNSSTTVNQSAVAHEGGTVNQAGRDINPTP